LPFSVALGGVCGEADGKPLRDLDRLGVAANSVRGCRRTRPRRIRRCLLTATTVGSAMICSSRGSRTIKLGGMIRRQSGAASAKKLLA
jgi:hypothetical protein